MRKYKLLFIENRAYDERMIFEMFRPEEPAGLIDRATSMDIPLAKAKEIQRLPLRKAIKIIHPIVLHRYVTIGNELHTTRGMYQISWNQINDVFFTFIKNKTRHPWRYGTYSCVVSAFHRGISNWNGNIIARIWSENPFTMRKITAHELIISHIFSIFRTNNKLTKLNLSDEHIWAVAEIAAWALTGLEKPMLKFWPWITEDQKYPLHHNYPYLVPLQKTLKKAYLQSRSFPLFLEIAGKKAKSSLRLQ